MGNPGTVARTQEVDAENVTFETGSYYVTQVGLILWVLLLLPMGLQAWAPCSTNNDELFHVGVEGNGEHMCTACMYTCHKHMSK